MPKKFRSEEEKREYNRNTMARWRERNPEKVEDAKKAANKRAREWAQANPERHAENMARWRREFKLRDPEGFKQRENTRNKLSQRKLKAKVILEYGGKCACCGITESEFLTIHHTKGDGAEHRAALFPSQTRNRGGGGYRFWLWLQRNGFPKENFELHCFNCNCSKGFFGYCPHQKERLGVQGVST